FRHGLAKARNDLGAILQMTNRPKEAETAFRDALALATQLTQAFPTSAAYLHYRPQPNSNLGILLKDAGKRPKEAEAAYLAARAIFKQLVADLPDRVDFRLGLAGSLYNLGNLLDGTNRPKEAETAFREALALAKQLWQAGFSTGPDLRYG